MDNDITTNNRDEGERITASVTAQEISDYLFLDARRYAPSAGWKEL